MQCIFSEIKHMQYLTVPMGFDLQTPMNLQKVNNITLMITTFDYLPYEEIYAEVYTFTESEAASKGLERLGMDSKNFLQNGGTLFLTIQAWIAVCVAVTLPMWMAKCCFDDP